jgi:hypothetical protein
VQRLWLQAARIELPAVAGGAPTVIEAAPGAEWAALWPRG